MRIGWRQFGLYLLVVAGLITVVIVATSGGARSTVEVLALVAFIGAMSYFVTFAIWPRRNRVSPRHPSRRNRPPMPETADDHDARPVMVIGARPAGSRPGSRVHSKEAPTVRTSRGRRPGERQSTNELRWPTR